MGETRNKTLLQHLGFNDPDLLSPAHDALVLWISQNIRAFIGERDPMQDWAQCVADFRKGVQKECEYLQSECRRVAELESSRLDTAPHKTYTYGYRDDSSRLETPEEIAARIQKAQDAIDAAKAKAEQWRQRLGCEILCPTLRQTEIATQFEMPIMTGRDYIVGFIDVVATVSHPRLGVSGLRYKTSSGAIDGCSDAPTVTCGMSAERSVYLEAKPTIRSLGELLRQVRTYQEYAPYSPYGKPRFVVVSPDTRFRQAIESQGLEFWEAPEAVGNPC